MKINKENRIQNTAGVGHGPNVRRLECWDTLSHGERRLICSLMRLLRGAKRSQLWDVAKAAAEWERGIGCFIKVRLMNGYSATGNRKFKRKHVCIIVEPGNPQKN
jgi:hypothetical protein